MADVYRIKDWEPFETAQSKNYKTLNWVCLTNKHDGGSYRRLMARDDAMTVYAAWLMIVQVASKCEPRGTLINDGKPVTAEDIHFKTGGPIEAFEKAFEVLSSPEIDWIETITLKSTEVQESTSKSTESHFSLPTNPHQPKPKPKPHQPHQGNGEVEEGGDFFKLRKIDKVLMKTISDKIGRITKLKGQKILLDKLGIMSQLDYTDEATIIEAANAVSDDKPRHPIKFFLGCLKHRIDNFEERLAEIP